MKVLKKGSGQKSWAKKYKCTGKGNHDGGCGAELLVEESDLFRTHSGHYDGTTDHYVTFACCECGVWTDIPDRDLPSRIIDRLPDVTAEQLKAHKARP